MGSYVYSRKENFIKHRASDTLISDDLLPAKRLLHFFKYSICSTFYGNSDQQELIEQE